MRPSISRNAASSGLFVALRAAAVIVLFLTTLGAQSPTPPAPKPAPGPSPDDVIRQFVEAAGGAAKIDRIQSRQVEAKRGHAKVTYYWQKPNKVLLVDGKKKIGYDGGSGWVLSAKKHITRLPKGSQTPLEIDANPLRFANLKQLYSDVQAGAPVNVDNRRMDVLIAPNDRGSTKLFFDESNHLLTRVEETGETSAYFKHTIDFSDYQEIDGIKLPFRIIHQSTEPGAATDDLHISKVEQNVPLRPEIFGKPSVSGAVLGGKR